MPEKAVWLQRHLRLPIKLELQAPLLVIEPSFIEAEIARGGQASATLTLRNGGEAPLTLRDVLLRAAAS